MEIGLKKYARDYLFLFLFAGGIIALDQWTKHLVRTTLAFGEHWTPWPWLEPYARIVHWQNTGAVFGMFQGFGNIFAILAVIVSIAILYYFPQVPRSDWPLRLAMGMQLGGAVGNLIDRLTIGWVTDFVSVGRFAVFNVADASISVGVVVLLVGMWLKERAESRQPDGPAVDTPDDSQNPPASLQEGAGRE
jgi:signal peptidase II